VKKQLLRVLAVTLTVILLLTCVTSAAYAWWYIPLQEISLEPMNYSCVSDCWCGPSSGVSIGYYYKQQYTHLPSPKSKMYDALHEYMDTHFTGKTDPYNYGPGFVEMALHYGYDDFSYVHDDDVTADDWGVIKNAIENGWPVALASMGTLVGFRGVEEISTDGDPNDWPVTKWHWIAIKGVQYYGLWSYTWGQRIICTDNYSGANNLVLSWDQLIAEVGDFLEYVIIKDEDDTPDGLAVEDFEWGDDDDGDSLEDWQDNGGEVDWYVLTSGASVAEIDTEVTHEESQGSARFYKYNASPSSAVRAYYSLQQPSYIGFYLKKGDTAYASIKNGDGAKIIDFRINSAEQLQYYASGWHTLPGTLSLNWIHIEVMNIDWGAGTYDIYVNGLRKVTATMRTGSIYGGNLWFGSWTGSGEFWIDDITDSLR